MEIAIDYYWTLFLQKQLAPRACHCIEEFESHTPSLVSAQHGGVPPHALHSSRDARCGYDDRWAEMPKRGWALPHLLRSSSSATPRCLSVVARCQSSFLQVWSASSPKGATVRRSDNCALSGQVVTFGRVAPIEGPPKYSNQALVWHWPQSQEHLSTPPERVHNPNAWGSPRPPYKSDNAPPVPFAVVNSPLICRKVGNLPVAADSPRGSSRKNARKPRRPLGRATSVPTWKVCFVRP